jgi:hypothetical protein
MADEMTFALAFIVAVSVIVALVVVLWGEIEP